MRKMWRILGNSESLTPDELLNRRLFIMIIGTALIVLLMIYVAWQYRDITWDTEIVLP